MKASRKEAAALTRAQTIGAAEMNREQWWHMLPLVERMRALRVAGLEKERASNPLATFSDAERERVRLALTNHIGNMQLLMQVMAASNTNVHGFMH